MQLHSLRARIAANARWSSEPDRARATQPARTAATAALDARLLAEIDPAGTLSPGQRTKRLANARRCHFARLSLRAQHSRAARREAAARQEQQ